MKNVGAFPTHIFADDLCTLIIPPVQKKYQEMISFINTMGSKIGQNLFEYSKYWKQPINISKSVVQVFHSQVETPTVEVKMNKEKLETVKTFKYLGFSWTDKLSLKLTVDQC